MKLSGKNSIYLIIAITALSLLPIRNLRFDLSAEMFFPSNDKDVAFYQDFRNQFQTQIDEEFIFIGLTNSKGIFQKEFLQKTDSLTQYLSKLEHILKVYSVTNANIIFFKDSQINARPLIHIQEPQRYYEDSVYLFESPEYRKLLVSLDRRSL